MDEIERLQARIAELERDRLGLMSLLVSTCDEIKSWLQLARHDPDLCSTDEATRSSEGVLRDVMGVVDRMT